MNAGRIRGLFVLIGLLGGCAGERHARYAGWDPAPEGIPKAPSYLVALERLAQSRRLFHAWRAHRERDVREVGLMSSQGKDAYSYVRAEELAPERVRFTLLSVDEEHVTLRALVEADPSLLEKHAFRQAGNAVRSLWVERGTAVGGHAEGAPALTIEQLYEECARLIAGHSKSIPKLYFHPNGVLMHCGIDPEECDDCASLSIQSFSRYRIDEDVPLDDPARWVCTRGAGVFPPGATVPTYGDTLSCWASAACRAGNCPRALWTQVFPSPCAVVPAREPKPLELGKADPLAAWEFPFRAGNHVECGSKTQPWRIQPVLPARRE